MTQSHGDGSPVSPLWSGREGAELVQVFTAAAATTVSVPSQGGLGIAQQLSWLQGATTAGTQGGEASSQP